MPPKRKRIEKKEHPLVEHWLNLSLVAKSIAVSTKQQQQYIALLLQISVLTQHDITVPDTPWTGEHIDFEDIRNYILSWLDDFDETIKTTTKRRDNALQAIRNVEPQNDENLKAAAAELTEAEININQLDAFTNRWKRIVRYKKGKTTLREHTDTWLTRWLREWELTNAKKSKYVKQYQELVLSVSRDSVSPVLMVPGR